MQFVLLIEYCQDDEIYDNIEVLEASCSQSENVGVTNVKKKKSK